MAVRKVEVNGTKYHYSLKRYPEGYIAICKEIPEVGVYGKTLPELNRKLVKAITGYLDVFRDDRVQVTA